jgi:hypothetical protein
MKRNRTRAEYAKEYREKKKKKEDEWKEIQVVHEKSGQETKELERIVRFLELEVVKLKEEIEDLEGKT